MAPSSFKRPDALIAGHRLARSIAWNLAAQLLPLGVAIVCIPLIIEVAGLERLGILTLAWALIGYCSLFDFGLGRALTKVVAERCGTSTEQDVPALVWTGIVLMAMFGAIGAGLVFTIAPWIAGAALRITGDLQQEAVSGFRLVALAIPLVTVSAGLRGVTEAYQRFGAIAAINVSISVLTLAGPLVALSVSRSVDAMAVALVIARLTGCLAYALSVARNVDGWFAHGPSLETARPLLRFGTWMTVSNVVGPLMDYMDRFIVGAVLSVTAVAYYATPFDVVSRLAIIAGALSGVLFPALSTALASDRPRAVALYETGIRHLLLAVTVPVVLLVTFAHEGLDIWLGEEFAARSETVVQWLAVGILINTVARMPYALLQAAGRPEVTGKLHIVELPCYLALVWWLVSSFGISGAAAAWTLRATADALLLLYLARMVVNPRSERLSKILWVGAGLVGLVAGAAFIDALSWRIAYFAGVMAMFGWLSWRWLLEPGEIARILGYFARSTQASRS